jgi:hypothetical protein
MNPLGYMKYFRVFAVEMCEDKFVVYQYYFKANSQTSAVPFLNFILNS